MWYRSYRNHVIMAFPSFDTATKSWAPQANISWVAGPVRESAFVRFPMRVISEGEAVASALAAARVWIDDRKNENRELRDPAPETRARELPVARLLGTASTRPKTRALAAGSRNARNVLSYDDFKANLEGLGMTASEGSLLKSYDALIKLRKSSHRSWAQIKSLVKRCQNAGTGIQTPRRRSRPITLLPLTPQGWRRI